MTVLTVIFPYFNQNHLDIDYIWRIKNKDSLDTNSVLKVLKIHPEESFLLPCLKTRIESLFTKSKRSQDHKEPDCSEFLLVILALLILDQAAGVEQILVLLVLLFPGLSKHRGELKQMICDTLTEEKEFVIKEIKGRVHYKINTIEMRNSRKMLEDFVQNQHNFNDLKNSFFDPKCLAGLFKSIGIMME